MKKAIKFISSLMIVLASVFAMQSCNESSEPARPLLMSIVTYTGSAAGSTTFLFQTGNGSEEVTLYTSQVITGDIKPGTRVAIVYYAPDDVLPTTSCQIELTQIGYVENGTVEVQPTDSIEDWNAIATQLVSMWRAGRYVNMIMQVQGDYTKQKFELVADSATLGDAYPKLYLINTTRPDISTVSYTYYASFDIDRVWSIPTAEGLTISVDNSYNMNVKSFTFSKSDNNTNNQ